MTLAQINTLPTHQRFGAIARVLTGEQAEKWVKAEREALLKENLERAQQHLGPLAGKVK